MDVIKCVFPNSSLSHGKDATQGVPDNKLERVGSQKESTVKPGKRLGSLLPTRLCVGTHLKIG